MHRDAVPLVDRLALGAIVVAAGARVMISFSSIPVFDIDPAVDGAACIGATPPQSVLLDALALAGASWLLGKRALSGLSFDWWRIAVALGCLPAIAIALLHGWGDAEQLWRGSTWIAGIAVALMMILQSGAESQVLLRRAAVAALAGIAVVMAVRGVAQLTDEHMATVAYYEHNRETFLRSQGWLADSPQALTYERRLMQLEATGWFGFANVFATVAAGSAVLLANLAIGRGSWIERAWILFCAVLCAGLVVASGSKGGIAALAIGALVSFIIRRCATAVRWIAIAIPFVAIGGVIARGLIGSQWGEQSLLFRWQYLIGAVRTFAESPWTGVGPAGFQSSYIQVRPIESVEEVMSAHGAFADWMVALGVAGIGLVVLQLVLAWRCAPKSQDAPSETKSLKGTAEIAVASVVFAAVISIVFEAPSLDIVGYAWRIAGLGAGAATAIAAVRLIENPNGAGVRAAGVGLFGLACVVLAHGQIDMVFWVPGSALWGWLVLALAAWWNGAPVEDPDVVARSTDCSDGGPRRSGFTRWIGASLALSIAGIAGWLVFAVMPALRAQDDSALHAAQFLNDEAQAQSISRLAAARAQVGGALSNASKIWPIRSPLALRAAEQWRTAAESAPAPKEAAEWLRLARESAVSVASLTSSSYAAELLISTIAIREAELASRSWEDAERAIRRVLELNPRHCESWIRLSMVLAKRGETLAARAALMSALECDETFALDPLRRFTASRRELIERQFEILK